MPSADPIQRARRIWFLAWLPLFFLFYLFLNAVPFFRAIYVHMGMGVMLPIPTKLAMDASDLLGWGWGLPGFLGCLVLPYGTWMCVRERGRLRLWAAGCVFVSLLVLLILAQIGMWAPLNDSTGMIALGEDGKPVRNPRDARVFRWVLLETWKPHWGKPPTQGDLDHLKEASASR